MGHVYAVTKRIELECQTNTDRLTALHFTPDVGHERRYSTVKLVKLVCDMDKVEGAG